MKLHIESDGARAASFPARGGQPPEVGPDGRVCLPLRLPMQERPRWCWAAIGSAMADFYGTPALSQREVAARMTGGDGEASDVNLKLDRVLTRIGCHGHWSPGRPTFDRIAWEIGRGHPLAVRIEWLRGDAHYALVTGYESGARRLEIADSLHGPSWQDYDRFPRDYRNGGGLWTETFWTNHMGDT